MSKLVFAYLHERRSGGVVQQNGEVEAAAAAVAGGGVPLHPLDAVAALRRLLAQIRDSRREVRMDGQTVTSVDATTTPHDQSKMISPPLSVGDPAGHWYTSAW